MLPPEDLDCPDPGACPVVSSLPVDQLRCAGLRAGTPMFRCYDGNAGYAAANDGYGDTRFAPFDDDTGRRVPTMYIADSDIAALLETAFHDVDHSAAVRAANADALVGRLLALLSTPVDLHVADLRDPELDRVGVAREHVVSSAAEHYPCTRRLAKQIHAAQIDGRRPDGILWHSRQSELAFRAAAGSAGPMPSTAEVALLFCDRVPHGRGTWSLRSPGLLNLLEGAGRERLDQVANQLDVVIVE